MSLNRSAPIRTRDRARRVAAGAAALVLTLALASPVQAAPGADHASVLSSVWARIQAWLDGLPTATPTSSSEDGPVTVTLQDGCEMDPAGSSCESAESDSPSVTTDPDSELQTQ